MLYLEFIGYALADFRFVGGNGAEPADNNRDFVVTVVLYVYPLLVVQIGTLKVNQFIFYYYMHTCMHTTNTYMFC